MSPPPPAECRIAVVTGITSARETIRDDQNGAGAQFVAFVDRPCHSRVWREETACRHFSSARRNARMHKILVHQFVPAEYSVWLDGNVALRVPAPELVADWLQDCDLATFAHRTRRCTYEEAAACLAQRLDSPELITAQMENYRRHGLEPGAGLPETTVVVRRHTAAVCRFNNHWWSELCRYSLRDQLSFVFAARQTGLRVRLVTPTKFDHPYFHIRPRPAGAEPLPGAPA